MAATSLAGQACVSPDALPSVPRQVSVQMNGPFRPGHRCARYMVARSVLTVGDASAVRVAARSGACRYPAPCRELARGCRWASGDGKELVCVQVRQKLRPLDERPLVACRAEMDVLPVALH